jgi:hypothetical protein
MVNYTVDEFNRTKSRMAGVFNKAISDAEEAGRAASEVSGNGSAVAQGVGKLAAAIEMATRTT